MTATLTRLSFVGRTGLPARADPVLATALAIVAVADLWLLGLNGDFDGREIAATPFALAVPAALAWRRRHPVRAALAASGALALQGVATVPTTSVTQIAAMLLLAFSLGAHASLRDALLGLASQIAAIVSVAAGAGESAGSMASIPLFLAVPWFAGMTVRAARGYARRLELLAEQLERERERSARLAVAEERAVIARELHDVVSSGVGAMTVQAGGARRIVDRDPEAVRTALGAIESAGRAALVELERMLSLMRAPHAEPAAPVPGFMDLPGLVARMRSTGLDVDFSTHGSPPEDAPALGLAVYRVVQEALANAAKHAAGARVDATVRYGGSEVDIHVSDEGNGHPVGLVRGGHGLLGMRERVLLFGGELHAGPAPAGGFRIHARIPLPERGP